MLAAGTTDAFYRPFFSFPPHSFPPCRYSACMENFRSKGPDLWTLIFAAVLLFRAPLQLKWCSGWGCWFFLGGLSFPAVTFFGRGEPPDFGIVSDVFPHPPRPFLLFPSGPLLKMRAPSRTLLATIRQAGLPELEVDSF